MLFSFLDGVRPRAQKALARGGRGGDAVLRTRVRVDTAMKTQSKSHTIHIRHKAVPIQRVRNIKVYKLVVNAI